MTGSWTEALTAQRPPTEWILWWIDPVCWGDLGNGIRLSFLDRDQAEGDLSQSLTNPAGWSVALEASLRRQVLTLNSRPS